MDLKISTGLANALAGTSSLRTALAGAHIYIYSGTMPASADAAISADSVLLCDISGPAAAAINWDATPIDGALMKDAAQTWSGVNAATGTASYFRIALPADTGAASNTAVRLQGDVGVAGAVLNLSSLSLAQGATQTINYGALVQPLQ